MQKIENEFRPAQTNGIHRIKSFVNVHLHFIVSNLKKISKVSTLLLLEKFLRTPMVFQSWFTNARPWFANALILI